eukprot:11559000-Alexandrium_andersonii.AAC.1
MRRPAKGAVLGRGCGVLPRCPPPALRRHSSTRLALSKVARLVRGATRGTLGVARRHSLMFTPR